MRAIGTLPSSIGMTDTLVVIPGTAGLVNDGFNRIVIDLILTDIVVHQILDIVVIEVGIIHDFVQLSVDALVDIIGNRIRINDIFHLFLRTGDDFLYIQGRFNNKTIRLLGVLLLHVAGIDLT